MKKIAAVAALIGIFVGAVASGQAAPGAGSSLLSVQIQPTFDIPIAESTLYFDYGASVDLNLQIRGTSAIGFLVGGLGYAFTPLQSADSLSIVAGKLGLGIRLPLASWFAIEIQGMGGYYYGILNDLSVGAGNLYAAGEATLQIGLSPGFDIGIGAIYRQYFGLYEGLGAAVRMHFSPNQTAATPAGNPTQTPASGVSPQPLATTITPIEIGDPTIAPIFPAFYKYYDDHPFGSIEIINTGDEPASDISVAVFIKQYMDNPKPFELDDILTPGNSAQLDLYALFTNQVLSITEGTKASAEITVTYTMGGEEIETVLIETVRFLNRNAMTWDDDRHAAAFVTARDPAVLTFSKNVVGLVRGSDVGSINQGLQTAMALHEALDLFGVSYVSDPTTPYIEFSTREDAIDFLQFPRQTMQYRAGDCDDLSILYSALLESVGVSTAFVTTPGHIFVAIDSGLSAKDAVASLMPANQIIVHEETAWIPVEITLRDQGFLKAWEEGAREWNEAVVIGRSGFYPIEDAWKAFEPIGLPGTGSDVAMPTDIAVVDAYSAEKRKYIDQAIYPIVTQLQADIQSTGSLRSMNKLGVLYARYGQVENATIICGVLAEQSDYVPAILNLGNIAYLKQDWQAAQRYYDQAQEIRPDDAKVLLAVARVNLELQNYGNVERTYAHLQQVDRQLAQQFAYLGGGAQANSSRGADVLAERRKVVWDEE